MVGVDRCHGGRRGGREPALQHGSDDDGVGAAAGAGQHAGDRPGRPPQQQVHLHRHQQELEAARVHGHLPRPLPQEVPRPLPNLQDLLL